MNFSDYSISFLLAVLLHALGLLAVSFQISHEAAHAARAPELDVTSVTLTLAESEIDAPASRNSEPRTPNPDTPVLPLPAPVEPAAPETLPDKPDFTEALTPPPLPALQPQPSPVVIPQPAPSPTPVLIPPPSVLRPPSSSPAPAAQGPQVTLQPVNAGGAAYGRVDAHPSLERAIKPNYPIGSRRRGEEGTVILDVTVAADGSAAKVSRVSSSGFPDLDRAAERAAVQARFKPGTRDGQPVESAARLTLIFRLRDS